MAQPPNPEPARLRVPIVPPLIGLSGHVLVGAAAYLAPRVWQATVGTGWDDLAAIVVVLLFGEIIFGLACVIGAIVLMVQRKPIKAIGLLAGWLIGLIIAFFLVFT